MLNLRKLTNCKLKEIGILSNSLLAWWLVNPQLKEEAWVVEVSKAHNLQLERTTEETVKTEQDHLFKEEILQIMEQDE